MITVSPQQRLPIGTTASLARQASSPRQNPQHKQVRFDLPSKFSSRFYSAHRGSISATRTQIQADISQKPAGI